ncbi:Ppx/GppA phosphatase family protein [Fusibacter ferrireducens]|uniref:Ppx/GppA family phosphatase n=1 Tax=Fusibacter ferrireducens TaxID=2785058 RepID=A0ABR9ZMX0_9FIRM|nr:Ppx/GppA phosphatase family protein [Fusibacter ferrireducens]MBF4691810.1 Ppx/GppA family phosphatase [Fusibacter ferrireducens]
MDDKIAVIDLGSNSVRLNIYGINELGGYSVFEQAKEMVRLSEGLDQDNLLKPEPINRTLSALRYFKRLMDVNKVSNTFALSTAAVRMAENQKYFLETVKTEIGIEFNVLTGQEEAYYDYLGVVNTIAFSDAILVDIGGGSTEIVLVKNRELIESISLPYGSVILTEHFKKQKNRKKQIENAENFILDQLKDIPWLKAGEGLPIIGLGGIIRSLGKVHRNLNRYPIENLHNYKMTSNDVNSVIDLIKDTDPDDLDKIDGINKRRADLMTLGSTPVNMIMKYVEAPEMRISAYGLRDGYFLEYLNRDRQQSAVFPDVLEASVQNMMKRFFVNQEHAYQVEKIAVKLFEGLASLHDFDANDLKLLRISALLHDIGMHIEYYDHHLHGMYLLMNSKVDGLTNIEHLAVAFLVGNHRSYNIKDRFKIYEPFIDKDFFNKYTKLAVILQISEQLDRAEIGNIINLTIDIRESAIYIKLESDEMPTLDMESAMRFSDRVKKYYGKNLHIYF